MIRKETIDDLPRVREVYASARAFMKATGNPHQWGDHSPAEELILKDISEGKGYVLTEENGRIYGVFHYAVEDDPTYHRIDGAWINDHPYGVIHRIASDGTHHGVLEEVLEFAEQSAPDIRIDTHHDNQVMQHLLAKNGFTRCGIIWLLNGEPRIAYQRAGKNEH